MKTISRKLFTFILIPGLLSLLMMSANDPTPATGYKVGDNAKDFNLKNIDGKKLGISSYKPATKGAIIIFTCNHCPFSKAYEDRIIALNNKYQSKGYPVIAINPNDPAIEADDSWDNMKVRAKEKGFNFPYLLDESQEFAKAYGAVRTPHVFVVQKENGAFIVKYIGAIDDNKDEPAKVTKRYVENAVDELLAGKPVSQSFTKAIGCGIKWKK
jgi:peroxiredoxin